MVMMVVGGGDEEYEDANDRKGAGACDNSEKNTVVAVVEGTKERSAGTHAMHRELRRMQRSDGLHTAVWTNLGQS